MSLPESLKHRILADVAKEASPVRSLALLRTVLLWLMAAAVVVVSYFALGGFHSEGRPLNFVIGTASGWALAGVLLSLLALFRGKSMLGTSRPLLLGATIATPMALFAWMLLFNVAHPETFAVCKGRVGFVCLDLALTIGAVPLLAVLVARRGTDPVHPGATGAALGAAIGCWVGVTLDLSCECTNPSHILLGHVLPVALLVGAGALLGRRLLAKR